jgi:parvulin-like peptidyl-prolyl isomerase
MPVVRLLRALLVVSSAAAIAVGCAGSGDIPDDAICRVGDTTVSKDRQDQAFAAARSQAKARTGKAPKGDAAKELQRQVAAQLVTAAAWRSIAQDEDLDVTDKQVKAAEKELVKTGFGGDRDRYVAQLQVEGRTTAQARADLRDQLWIDAVRDHASDSAKVSASEARKWLEAHPGDFGGTPRTREVQHVLIRAGGKSEAKDDAAAKAFAERTRRELDGASEAEFAAIAKRFSDDPSYGPTGGTFTYEAGTIDPAFEKAAFELDEGELSGVVRTRLGWHVIVPRGAPSEADLPSLDEVADEVRAAALADEREAALAKLQHRVERVVKDADCRAAYRPRRESSKTSTSGDSTHAEDESAAKTVPDTETATP